MPAHPKKHHKPFRLRHVGLFLAGLTVGVFGFQRGGYIENRPFDINSATPGVVKIYHVVCGTLTYAEQNYSKDLCESASGSGMIISKDGYVATNGHVVSVDAPGLMSKELAAQPWLLSRFSTKPGIDLTPAAGESREMAFLKKLYELPKDRLSLENRREVTYVALSDRPLMGDAENLKQLFDLPDTNFIKKADIIASDYSAKDMLPLEYGGSEGFSARDVAVLKINTREAPLIRLGDGNKINQNEPITLVGFPIDADNQLTANNIITPTVTNGNISSIRTTNGKISRLFQTDADASQGNSGGPALNKNGEAIGIVTYRFKDRTSANAAKSYVREINDLKELLTAKSIKLKTDSTALAHWEEGLELAAESKYSAAIQKYKLALEAYPAHRLARTYITQAETAIKEGKDVKEPPYTLLLTVGAIVIGGGTIILSALLMARHHAYHRRYKRTVTAKKTKRHPKPSKKS